MQVKLVTRGNTFKLNRENRSETLAYTFCRRTEWFQPSHTMQMDSMPLFDNDIDKIFSELFVSKCLVLCYQSLPSHFASEDIGTNNTMSTTSQQNVPLDKFPSRHAGYKHTHNTILKLNIVHRNQK